MLRRRKKNQTYCIIIIEYNLILIFFLKKKKFFFVLIILFLIFPSQNITKHKRITFLIFFKEGLCEINKLSEYNLRRWY